MLCPNCHGELEDDASICSFCDAILDDSFLENDVPTAPRDEVYEPSPDYIGRPPLDDAPPLDDEAPALGGEDIGGGGGGGETSIIQMDPEQQKHTRIVKVTDLSGRRAAAAHAVQQAKAADGEGASELEDYWGQVTLAYRRLRVPDRIALFCVAALVVGAFLPWFEVKGKGFVSGVEGRGWLTALFAVLAVAVFWVRVTFRKVLLVLAQVGFIVGAALAAGYAYTHRGDADPIFGIYLTLIAGVAAAVLSLVAALKSS